MIQWQRHISAWDNSRLLTAASQIDVAGACYADALLTYTATLIPESGTSTTLTRGITLARLPAPNTDAGADVCADIDTDRRKCEKKSAKVFPRCIFYVFCFKEKWGALEYLPIVF